VTATTLVVPPEALAAETWRIEGEAHHHLFRVKRLATGDPLRLTDGAGHARFAEVVTISKREALARLGGEAPGNESPLAVELFVAPPKPERAAWLVEKATEIGVAAVRFLPAERGARELGAAKIARLRRVAVAAVEQCGRAVVPAIGVAAPLPVLIEGLLAEGVAVRALLSGADPLGPAPGAGRVALLLGPEGGWSPAERALFDRMEVPRGSLGERILRVETAALVAAGILLAPQPGAG